MFAIAGAADRADDHQVFSDQCRVYLFSYAYPAAVQDALQDENAMLDPNCVG
ncbi:hypothetical protein [Rhizocola hellebori]|uniref:hypothetical protein n=1 Tax=Rhizocola hellebori TaxID=1392758 RepID=UPI001940FDA5|nr:hypothetical protein [Rhizocola hellebori]